MRVKNFVFSEGIRMATINLTLNDHLVDGLKERGMVTVPCLEIDGELIQDSVEIIKRLGEL
jgi:glutaredoxin